MKPFVDYAFYTSIYKGLMPETDFNRFVMIATQKIKLYTFGRIEEDNIQEEIKYCACVLVDKIEVFTKNENKTSESVSSWSISYKDSSSCDDIITDTLKEFLSDCRDKSGTPLLYRGC